MFTWERCQACDSLISGLFYELTKAQLHQLRGPGDFFGIRQSGLMEFKMADVFNDAPVLMEANKAAAVFRENDAEKVQEV